MARAPVAELEAYRDEADRFIAALDEEYYLHFAGLKDEFELSPIYERFSDLTTLDACRRLAASAEIEGGAPASSGASGARATWETSPGRTPRRSRGSRPRSRPPWTGRRSATGSCVPRSPTSPTAPGANGSTAPASR